MNSAGGGVILGAMPLSLDDKATALGSAPILAGAPRHCLEQIAAICGETEFSAGQLLTEAREPGTGMFVILDGRVGVHARGIDTELGPGEVVGEVALLRADSKRIARVQALTDVRVLTLDRARFRELLESDGKLAIALLENLAGRIPS